MKVDIKTLIIEHPSEINIEDIYEKLILFLVKEGCIKVEIGPFKVE